jgi:hypothetical protein
MCKILFINKMISDQCFVIVLTVLKDTLHIYPPNFKERQDIVFTPVPPSVCHTFIVTLTLFLFIYSIFKHYVDMQ